MTKQTPRGNVLASAMKTKYILASIIGALVLSISVVGFVLWRATQPVPKGGLFTLQSAQGAWSLQTQAKDLNLIYFGYTSCPDACPLTLSYLASVYAKLTPEQQARMQVIFISVDSEHDKPQNVGDYVKNFNPNFVGLTGNKADIDSVVNLFKTSYIIEENPRSRLGYSVAHSDRVYFVNREGQVVDEVDHISESSEVLKQIKEHL